MIVTVINECLASLHVMPMQLPWGSSYIGHDVEEAPKTNEHSVFIGYFTSGFL